MQLVAYGAQDIYLTGNPQITFFKVVYRRHTNFSMEAITQTLNGSTQGTATSTATCTISRNGDLVSKVYVNYTGLASTNGSALINEVELEIGGQRIDRHYQEWNELWNELSTDESKAIGLKSMQRCIGSSTTTGAKLVQVPLNFWFCRNPGLALPLIALQYHEVKIKFTWGDVGGSVTEPNPDVVCDYIYLDTDERRRFAQVSHEYLIEQVQKEDKTVATQGTSNTHKLNFNHPVKELIWTTSADDELSAVKLTLNGHDRFSERDQEYFTLRQPFDYHTAVPRQNLPAAAQLTSNMLNAGVAGDEAVGGGDATTVTEITSVAHGATQNSTTIASPTAMVGLSDVTLTGSATLGGNVTITGTMTSSSDANKVGLVLIDALLADTGFTVANIGKLFQITGQGKGFLGATATTTATHNVRLTGVQAGAGAAGGNRPESTVSVVSFDKNLFTSASATASGALSDAGEFKITSVRLLNAEAALASEARTSQMTNKINVYSFALKPEEHQPSGTCNFSRIDNANLIMSHTAPANTDVTIYAVNYNVLRIMSGMGGLAYSN